MLFIQIKNIPCNTYITFFQGIKDDFHPPVQPRSRGGRLPSLPLNDLSEDSGIPASLLSDAPPGLSTSRRGGAATLMPPEFSPESSPGSGGAEENIGVEPASADEEEEEALTNYRDKYAQRRRSRAVLYHLSGSYQNQKRSGKLQLNTKVSLSL